MTVHMETEWSGYHQDKDALRSKIWTLLKESGASPREPFGHIPSFVGAEAAAARLAEQSFWHQARVIKSNPDTAHAALRLRALRDNKLLYMAVPRLAQERCFVELSAEAVTETGLSLKEVAVWQGAMEYGHLVAPDEMPQIDLVLVGCVAVSRGGGRIGKGAGFADLELGILRELGLLRPETPIVAAVHPLQIVPDQAIPMDPHDSPLGWIVTPDEIIKTDANYPQPRGIDWSAIRPEQYESIPVLTLLRSQLKG